MVSMSNMRNNTKNSRKIHESNSFTGRATRRVGGTQKWKCQETGSVTARKHPNEK